ncbi:MAG: hypothetical protein IRY99_04995, partial [Isosphaeraceae bacterium]|nr:hypothetical protein [Isosphaeraceae bacterium]
MNRRTHRILAALAALSVLYLVGYLGIWQWMVCRIEVPAGYSLRLRYKGPFPFGWASLAPEGTLVQLDDWGRPRQIGILEAMPGPGRHFYSPLEYERTLVPDLVIQPGQLGIVTSKVGKPLPPGKLLADRPGYRGVWRRVLTPGRYRMNDYAYKVDIVNTHDPASQGGPVASAVGLR